ncbi:MAG: MBL fold metallo-hydrolase [Desulfobacterales bacterium]
MSKITEIGPNVFKIATFFSEVNIQFNQFLVRDEEPLLYHTGMRGLFPTVNEAVAKLIDPATIRWIGFSHFEADECGALREWQKIAPNATAICSFVSKMVSVDDVVAERPARALEDGEVFVTGKFRFKFLQTPHVPHGWDAGHLFEENGGTLLCSDLFHQNGDVEAVTNSEIVSRFKETLIEYQKGPFANYLPYTTNTEKSLNRLADLKPKTIASMHGSTYVGDGESAIRDLLQAMKDVLAESA